MTTTAGRWTAATASVRGASHERDGRPNQDAVRVIEGRGATPGLVAAVCDGHGGNRYVRSDVGSRFGAEVACEIGRRVLDDLGASPTGPNVEAHLAGVVARAIVERWRERVLEDVRRHSFTDDERVRAGTSLDDDPFLSYGCTLLLAIMAPSWIGLLQIGDGDVTVVRDAHAESPVPGDDRLVGGETTSLCLPTAVADARVSALLEPLPEAIILTSDGYANSFASPTWRTDAGIDLRDHTRRIGLDGVEARLPGWLADSAAAGGDDVSMALIYRVDIDAGLALGAAAVRSMPKTSRPASVGRHRRRGLVAVAVTLAAFGGVGVGWALARSGRATETTSLPSTPSTGSVITTMSTVAALVVPTSATTPSTTSPLTETAPIMLSPGSEPRLLLGENEGLLLTFNPHNPTSPGPVLFGRVQVVNWTNTLPAGWKLANGELTWRIHCYPALVVLHADGYIWAVDPSREHLTSYDPETGQQVGSVLIPGGGNQVIAPNSEQPCASGGKRENLPPAGSAGSDNNNSDPGKDALDTPTTTRTNAASTTTSTTTSATTSTTTSTTTSDDRFPVQGNTEQGE